MGQIYLPFSYFHLKFAALGSFTPETEISACARNNFWHQGAYLTACDIQYIIWCGKQQIVTAAYAITG